MKKGQGLSLNVIIIAAVVLIVLVVLWSIFTGKMGEVSEEFEVCRGYCRATSLCADGAIYPAGEDDCVDRLSKESSKKHGSSVVDLGIIQDPPVCCLLK